MLEDIDRVIAEKSRQLEQALEAIPNDLPATERLRRRQLVREQPEFGLVRWKGRGASDEQLAELASWLPGLSFPPSYLAFRRWCGAFGDSGPVLGASPVSGFASSALRLGGPGDLQLHLQQIYYVEKKPLEFRRLLIVGEFERHDIGIWLSEEAEHEGEVVLFAQRHPNAVYAQDEFFLLSRSFESFLRRIAFCVERDIPLNPVRPSDDEMAWLRDNEGAVFPMEKAPSFTFRDPGAFPEKWRVKDPETEYALVIEPVVKRFKLRVADDAYKKFIKKHQRQFYGRA